jgi:linoleate 10R-lipoxygenase
VHANFTANFFDIPLRANTASSDGYTDAELYETLSQLFGYVFLDLDPAQSFKHRVVATRETKRLGDIMRKPVADVKAQRFSILRHMVGMGSNKSFLPDYGNNLVSRLFDGEKATDDVVWTIIPTAAAACATQAQGVRLDFPANKN